MQESPDRLRSQLVAYCSPASADQAAMLAAAQKQLPHYMIPVQFVLLDNLPQLLDGKVCLFNTGHMLIIIQTQSMLKCA